jgi:hypothetical protein
VRSVAELAHLTVIPHRRRAYFTEDPIGAGLNGPADRSADGTADGMLGGVPAGPIRPGEATVATVSGLLRRTADWLDRQSLAPTSLTGVCLALGICAGAWFTAGTRAANINGAFALAAAYLAALAARQFAARQSAGFQASAGQTGAGQTGADQAGAGQAGARLVVSAGRADWLAALGGRIAESAVYAGLAIGATAQGWGSIWPLAIAVISLVAIRATMTSCSKPADPDLSRAGPIHRAVVAVLSMPFGGRVLLIAVAAPVWGARASLLGLLDWAVIAVGYGIGSRTAVRRRARRRAVRAPRTAPAEPGGLAMLLNPVPPAQPAPPTHPAAPQAQPGGYPAPPHPADPPAHPAASQAQPGGYSAPPPHPADPQAPPGARPAQPPAARPATRPGPPAPGRQPIQVLRMELSAPPPGIVLAAGSGLSADGSPAAAAWDGDEYDDPYGAALAGAPGGALGNEPHEGGPGEPGASGQLGRPGESGRPGQPGRAGQYDASERRTLAMIRRCRDDGVISIWFGKLARGQLMPLPPALLALVAVAMLARLGLHDLPGLLILAPAIVMLVAAPGASHRHDGRFDWLVPGVLQGAQYIYIAALGVASAVPVTVTFALCAVVALRYADLGSSGSPVAPPWRSTPRYAAAGPATAQPATTGSATAGPVTKAGLPADAATGRLEPGAWLGWEGRMIVCGLGAAMGIATFAYLALAAYLGVLICWKVMTSSLVLREGDYR